MRNNKDSRQQSFCRACGLIVIDSVCPYCSSTIDEPVIHKSKGGYQPRLTGSIGVFLLIVAGVTPAVVSARESIETATIPSLTVVLSTTSAVPVMESTSTTLSSLIVTNESNNSKNSTSQKPKKKKPSSSGTVYVAPVVRTTTTTTIPPGPMGKASGETVLWRSADSRITIYVSVSKESRGDNAYVWIRFPKAIEIDPSCSGTTSSILRYENFSSLDGAAPPPDYFTPGYFKIEVPGGKIGCDLVGSYTSYSSYSKGNWRLDGKAQSAPRNFYFKFRMTNLKTGEVVESPWVLVDWSTIP
jgi:hypothetical protein